MERGKRNLHDRNRELMLKFRFGTITAEELDEFHDAVKNIIYKTMHRNPVMMNFEDVYHEIWWKICRFRHTWNPGKDTMVSTWITIVAESVINSIRKRLTRRMRHEALYEDISPGIDCGSDGNPSGADYLAYSESEDEEASPPAAEYSEIMERLYSELEDECDKRLLDLVEDLSDELATATVRKRKKLYRRIASEIGISEDEIPGRMWRLQKAYQTVLLENGISFR